MTNFRIDRSCCRRHTAAANRESFERTRDLTNDRISVVKIQQPSENILSVLFSNRFIKISAFFNFSKNKVDSTDVRVAGGCYKSGDRPKIGPNSDHNYILYAK